MPEQDMAGDQAGARIHLLLPVERVIPDAASLTTAAVSTERRDWWLARLERSYALLAS